VTIQQIVSARDRGVVSIGAADAVRTAVSRLAEERIGALPVIDGGRPVGVFSERDLLRCVHELGPAALDRSVADSMTAPAITVRPDTGVLVALSLMTRRRVRHLPVVDADGVLIDFISIGDLVKFRMDRIESEASALRDYIAG